MPNLLQKIVINNAPLKIVSLVLGYTLWYMLASNIPITRTYRIPLCFYNSTQLPQHAPEEVMVTLYAKRAALESFMSQEPAIHINAALLSDALEHHLSINRDNLFLPEGIKLVNYSPTPLLFKMH